MEYEALLAGLCIAHKLGARNLEAHVDSMLVAGQINGSYYAKDATMNLYLEHAKSLMGKFDSCKVIHIKRSENKLADALSKIASTTFEHMAKEVRIEVLDRPSVPHRHVMITQTGAQTWMTPITSYLAAGTLPANKAEALKIKQSTS